MKEFITEIYPQEKKEILQFKGLTFLDKVDFCLAILLNKKIELNSKSYNINFKDKIEVQHA